jgi:hypothetical protein
MCLPTVFSLTRVADRVPVEMLVVLVAGMVPAPGESPADWWTKTGHSDAVRVQARRDGGLTGSDDPFVAFYHDVPRALAEEALSKERGESNTAYHTAWPLTASPDVPTRFVLCTEDRVFPPEFMRGVVINRLDIAPDEIASGHCVALSRPKELADLVEGWSRLVDHDDASLKTWSAGQRSPTGARYGKVPGNARS